MKITLKTLKNEKIDVQTDPSETILQVKEKVKALKGIEVDGQKLILKGKQTANEDTLEKLGVNENDVFIIMIVPKKSDKAAIPVEEPPKQAKPVAATPAVPVAPVIQPVQPAQPIKKPQSGPQEPDEASVKELCDMGFERDKVIQALKVAYGNKERAVEYLADGVIPPVGSQSEEVNVDDVINQLASNPQFQRIRDAIRANPATLPVFLEQLAQSSPLLYNVIAQNPEAFERILSEDYSSSSQSQGASSGPTPSQGQGQGIAVSPSEREAIQRLASLGFAPADAIQAYFAFDKNEQAAANYLFERLASGDLDPSYGDEAGGEAEGDGIDEDDQLFD